ncbi:MAG: IS607 family transposase, partial [Halothece sp.]
MYLTPQEAKEKLGYHQKTLSRWADKGLIKFTKSPRGHRRYLVSSLENITPEEKDQREVILYVRVSTHSQKDDWQSQREYVSSFYPQCKCISDLGSGLNFKRKKFLSLMEQVSKGEIKKIVVAQKDRLCRFGFDFVEWFCNLNECEIEVLNHTYQTPYEELMEDFMAIM